MGRPAVAIPQRPSPTASRRARLTDALPLLVIALGFAVVAVVVATQPSLTPGALRRAIPNSFGLHAIGDTGPYGAFPYNPFGGFEQRGWSVTLTLITVWFGATAALGSVVVDAIRDGEPWPLAVRWLAGFLPGYLMVLLPLKLLYGAVPMQAASTVALVAVPLCAVVVHRRALLAAPRAVRDDPRVLARVAGALLVVVVLFATAAVHRLQQGTLPLTQDSILYFLQEALIQLDGLPAVHYLAHFNAQSDEWLFNAPLVFSSTNYGDVWFPFYATQSISVVAFLCLVYGVVHRIAARRKPLAGALTAVAVFGSTLSIYPWVYVFAVSGGQPVIGIGHPGRHIAIVAPWAVLLLLRARHRLNVLTIGLLTLGLANLSLHALAFVGAAVVAALGWRALRGWRPALSASAPVRRAVLVAVPLAMALAVATFWSVRRAPSPA